MKNNFAIECLMFLCMLTKAAVKLLFVRGSKHLIYHVGETLLNANSSFGRVFFWQFVKYKVCLFKD